MQTRFMLPALVPVSIVLAGCGGDPSGTGEPTEALDTEEAVIAVYRGKNPEKIAQLGSALSRAGYAQAIGEDFYLAINKRELGQKWFLSAFSQQYFPGAVSTGAAFSLGTRVVSFKTQNGKLFVFDVDSNKKTSDTFDPEIIVEAYPIVENYSPFLNARGAAEFVLFDPAAGLNRFGVLSDLFASLEKPAQFAVELAFSQRFRKIRDGYSYDQVYTGYGDLPDPGSADLGDRNQFRASGTLGIALRPYAETPGYVPTALPEQEYYFRSDPKLVPNQGTVKQVAAKWTLKPGMQPIRWLISEKVKKTETDPIYKDYDVYGALKAGVENWNDALGFQVFEASWATPRNTFSDDDVNYVIYDEDPSFGAAFADWRLNPNTGEIRGASVYFNSIWLEIAHDLFTDDPAPSPLLMPRAKPARPAMVWGSMRAKPLCVLTPGEALENWPEAVSLVDSGITKKEKVERFVTHVMAHEVGHTLSLRHNFKGSLRPVSSSVMDYVRDEEAYLVDKPQSYDIAAVRYLYGLSPDLPQDPFCTDEATAKDSDCTRYDRGSAPLEEWHKVTYNKYLQRYLTNQVPPGSEASFDRALNRAINGVLQYVRASKEPEQRRAAWNIAIEPLRVPLAIPPGSDPTYADRADALVRRLLQRLYLDPADKRGDIQTDVPAEAGLHAMIIADVKANLLNGDGYRSFATRRIGVDVLKKMQTVEAYTGLLEARDAIRAIRPTLSGPAALQTDDLLARMDKATTPYFD